MAELTLTVPCGTHEVPALLWSPPGRTVGPVVLLGHGGSGHKRSERNVRLARWFARHAGVASLAVDGPFHGDRAVPGDGPTGYQRRIVERGAEATHERMTSDWLAALDASGEAGLVDTGAVAFVGSSMGARFGVPVCAALGSRLVGAVISQFGLDQSAVLPDGLAARDLVTASARQIAAPVLQQVHWDDEVFPRAGQFELFDLFPSPGKRLRVRPGVHAASHPGDEHGWQQWVAAHLPPSPIDPSG